MEQGLNHVPFTNPYLWLLAVLTAAAIHDTMAALFSIFYIIHCGKLREIGRSLASRPGRWICVAGFLGGPIGMAGYTLGIKFIGPAYVMPLTALFPALATILAIIFLKERVSFRAMIGLISCIAGAIIISYHHPDAISSTNFKIGLIMALIAVLGWGAEGVLSTKGMDLLDPSVAFTIRELLSATIYIIVVLPIFGGYSVLYQSLHSFYTLIIAIAALIGCMSYIFWYSSMNIIGVSRAMSLNVTYSLWGIIFSMLFTNVEINFNLILGAVTILLGLFFVVGNPKDLLTIRNN